MGSSSLSLLGHKEWGLIDSEVKQGCLGPVDALLGIHARMKVSILATDQHPFLCWLGWWNAVVVFLLFLQNKSRTV